MKSFDLHTALGRYTVVPWPNDCRVSVNPIEVVPSQSALPSHSWDPVMEAVLRAAVRASRARVELIGPGCWRIQPDSEVQRVLERLVSKAGGQVPDDTGEEPGAATSRTRAMAAARRLYQHIQYSEPLRHAVEAGEAICARTGSLRAWEVAIRGAEATTETEMEQLTVRILRDARESRAHEAGRRARRALVGVGEQLLPDSKDPVRDMLAWWDALPEAAGSE